MPKMRKRKCNITSCNRNNIHGKNKRIRLDKILPGFLSFQHSRNFMWLMRHGKRQNKVKVNYKDNTRMPELRKAMVTLLDDIGKCSGCHRMPERSFFYKGHQFPVCARCTGVCIGQLCAIITNIFYSVPLKISIAFLAIMGIDWGIQELNIKSSTNCRRVITGILGGFGLFNFYCTVIKKLFKHLHKIMQ